MTNFNFPQCLLVNSSAIKGITTGDNHMILTFKGGAQYTYEINKEFLSEVIISESLGKTFNRFKPSLKLI